MNSGVLQFRQASDTETDALTTAERTFEPTKVSSASWKILLNGLFANFRESI